MNTEELGNLLRQLYLQQETQLAEKFNRSLPFQDGLFDRWERARRLGFGEGASAYNSACVFGDVKVGASTWIGPYTVLDGSGGLLQIGAFCSISAGVHIYTHDTLSWALSGGRKPTHKAPVSIGDCCYIGSQSIIAAGVRIGSRCVIAANSFVNRAVPDATIVGGSPVRRLGIVVGQGESVTLRFDSPGAESKILLPISDRGETSDAEQ